MEKKGIIATISISLLCAILLGHTLVTWQTKENREDHEPPPPNRETNKETVRSLSSQHIQAQQDVEEAKSTLAGAEQEFDKLEFELAEAERYIEGLEFKGENPADYAEEGMLLLRPIIEKYEAKLAVIESAEKRLLEAQENLRKLEEEKDK